MSLPKMAAAISWVGWANARRALRPPIPFTPTSAIERACRSFDEPDELRRGDGAIDGGINLKDRMQTEGCPNLSVEGRRVAGGNGDFHIEGATFQDHPVGFNTEKFAADAIDHGVDPTPPEPVCPGADRIPLGPAMATCNTSLAGQPLASINFARTASETSSGVAVGSNP